MIRHPAELQQSLSSSRVPWLSQDLEAKLWARLKQEGWPEKRHAQWHYHQLGEILRPRTANTAPISKLKDSGSAAPLTLEFIDGKPVAWPGTLPEGIEIFTAQELRLKSNSSFAPFAARLERSMADKLAAAALPSLMAEEGVYLRVKKVGAPKSVRIIWRSQVRGATGTFSLIDVEPGAEFLLAEELHAESGEGLISHHTQLNQGEGSTTTYLRAELGAGSCYGQYWVGQGKASRNQAVLLQTNGNSSREEWSFDSEGKETETRWGGLFLGKGQQRQDLVVSMRHGHIGGLSEQLFKSVLADKAKFAFTGLIKILKDAQEVNSKQLSRGLLLNQEAEADSQPLLEIEADNVKANHGAAIGQLNMDQIFYLRSRGFSQAQAVRSLAQGYVMDVFMGLPEGWLKQLGMGMADEAFASLVEKWEGLNG